MHLEITTKIGCKLACHFCPQKSLMSSYKNDTRLLSVETFKTILAKVPLNVDIHFSGFVEPFLNPNTASMMRYAKEVGYNVHVYSTFVGLSSNNFDDFIYHPPKVIRVHVPDQYGMKVDDDVWIKEHDLFLKSGFTWATYMSMGPQTEKVKNYLSKKNIRVEVPTMLSRGGLIKDVQSRYISGPIECAMDRWHQNVLLPNGGVVVCCMDYSLTMPIGNLLTNTYDEIYLRAEEYKKNVNPPADSICRSCEWARGK